MKRSRTDNTEDFPEQKEPKTSLPLPCNHSFNDDPETSTLLILQYRRNSPIRFFLIPDILINDEERTLLDKTQVDCKKWNYECHPKELISRLGVYSPESSSEDSSEEENRGFNKHRWNSFCQNQFPITGNIKIVYRIFLQE